MPIVWRLMKSHRTTAAFDGEGARKYGGRWNSPGVAVAYAADSPALAALEVLVHVQQSSILHSYSLVSADVPPDLIETLPANALPLNWRQSPVPSETQAIGDAWVHNANAAVLQVPSAVLPLGNNYLLNPAHLDFAKIVMRPAQPVDLDPRLLPSQ